MPFELHAGGSVRPYNGPDIKLFILVGWGRIFLPVAWPTEVQLLFFFAPDFSKLFGAQESPHRRAALFSFLIHH